VILDLEPFELLGSVIELGSQSQPTAGPHRVLPLRFQTDAGGIRLALKRSDAVAGQSDG